SRPFSCFLTREPLTPLDAFLSSLSSSASSSPRVQTFLQVVADARHQAQIALEHSQSLQAARYNTSHYNLSFALGDPVMLWYPTRHVGFVSKLPRRYRGTYYVVQRASPVNYEISSLPIGSWGATTDIVHVSRLKKIHMRSPEVTQLSGEAM